MRLPGTTRRDTLPGWLGWLGLFGYVAAWDLSKRTETLSSAFAPHGTHGKRLYLGVWAFLTLHLLRLIPERYDPLRNVPTIRRKETTNRGGHTT